MPEKFDVIVVGSYSVDLIFTGMKEFPQPGKDVVATDFTMTPGEAFISAVSMHRLGIKVGWAADFGNDDFSRFALQCVRDECLDESLFVIHDRPFRRISAAASFPDERGFLTYYDPDPPIPAAIPALMKTQAKILFIPALYFGEFFNIGKQIIRSKQMILVMDGNSSSGDMLGNTKEAKSIRRAIRSTDIFLPNAREARRLSGEATLEAAIRKLGEICPMVVVKDGPNGSFGMADNQIFHVPAIQVDAKDTTGAGDNFNAGFLRAWLEGQPLDTCLKWGNIVGGLSTTELGGTTRKITCKEVQNHS
ncbi:MAG: carbohydrate kinase family protein [Anaerolineales bacterium]